MTTWHADFLDGYETTDLALPGVEPAPGEPENVELVATLIRRVPANQFRAAVLYVHGWNDYFFQTHLADHMADLGYDFYAVDLRRYGRSLRRGHLRGFITNLDDYALELDGAAEMILAEHDELLLMGHSTGGLIAALWASRNSELLYRCGPQLALARPPGLGARAHPGHAGGGRPGYPVAHLGAATAGSRLLSPFRARQPGRGMGVRHGSQTNRTRRTDPGRLVAGHPARPPASCGRTEHRGPRSW